MSDAEQSPQPILSDLPKEVLILVSKHLPLSKGELYHSLKVLALAGGLDLLSLSQIKQWYLKTHAAAYIQWLYVHFVEEQTGEPSRKFLERIRYNLLSWMEVNNKWRKACNPYPKDKRNVIDGFFFDNTWGGVTLPTDADGSFICGANNDFIRSFEYTDGLFMTIADESSPWDLPFDDGAICGIDGRDLRPFSVYTLSPQLPSLFNVIGKEISGKVNSVRVMPKAMGFFFMNPAVAIDLGIFEIVQYILEESGIGNKEEEEDGSPIGLLHSEGVREQFDQLPLIAHALIQPDNRLFDYLMTNQSVDKNPYYRGSLLHNIHNDIFVSRCCDEHSPIDIVGRLQRILNHDDVDVDEGIFFATFNKPLTPLWPLLHYNTRGYEYEEIDLHIASAFLNAGATTDDLDLQKIPTPNAMLDIIKAECVEDRERIVAKFISDQKASGRKRKQ